MRTTWQDAPAPWLWRIVECKEHDTPQSWQMVKILKQARYISTDHTPGKIYAFRVRALGPQGEGPWSDEAVKMSP